MFSSVWWSQNWLDRAGFSNHRYGVLTHWTVFVLFSVYVLLISKTFKSAFCIVLHKDNGVVANFHWQYYTEGLSYQTLNFRWKLFFAKLIFNHLCCKPWLVGQNDTVKNISQAENGLKSLQMFQTLQTIYFCEVMILAICHVHHMMTIILTYDGHNS